jgi:hypothetical protein
MKNFIVLSLILCGVISADVLPYKPKPILWVHGVGAGSGDWGAPTRNREDWIPAESIAAHPEGTYSHFLNDFMLPVVKNRC